MDENNYSTSQNQSQLYDLIQSIQSKMDNNHEINNEIKIKKETKENLFNNINQNEQLEKKTNINNENLNFSSLLNNLNLSNILDILNSNKNTNEDSFNFNKLDANTILKIQKIISNINKNDPKKDLLRSLKPFLRKSRQDKIGEYITILSLVDAIDIFGSKGSD